ncbi:hypothetical protein F383_22250 [Gossypium arboreum]|uniref:Uncharacterized protein n=1 Tax=Gossypium arboreum TaxID=29729 RepID=A0A0B0NLS0_GOSAR|nr:hypothetical protein F383_17046 [Gossypium arboreum]KHG17691.1 hypothetical protein F383_22250 [Gossypium arboreum]
MITHGVSLSSPSITLFGKGQF